MLFVAAALPGALSMHYREALVVNQVCNFCGVLHASPSHRASATANEPVLCQLLGGFVSVLVRHGVRTVSVAYAAFNRAQGMGRCWVEAHGCELAPRGRMPVRWVTVVAARLLLGMTQRRRARAVHALTLAPWPACYSRCCAVPGSDGGDVVFGNGTSRVSNVSTTSWCAGVDLLAFSCVAA